MNRRKNPWGLILVPLVLLGTALSGAIFAVLALAFHASMIPDDAILSRWSRPGGILMFVPLFFPSLLLGMLFANAIAWCIPPLRRMFDAPPDDPRGSGFGRAMKLLFRVWLVVLAVALPLSGAGAMSCFYVTSGGITIRPVFSGERAYGWSDVRAVDIRCHAEGGSLHLNYRVEMRDGARADLMQEGPVVFLGAYEAIRARLDAQPGIRFHRRVTPSGTARLERTYPPDTVRKIRRILKGEEKKP